MSSRRGFSLLEVMVAIAILGLALSAILASQADSAAWNKQAANYGVAVHLGRCKMTEIEEDLLKKGYLENDDIATEVACCSTTFGAVEMTGVAQYTCDTKVERVTMPDPPSGGFGASDAGTIGPSASSTPLGTILQPGGMDLDAGLSGLSSTLGGAEGAAGGGAGGMLSFVMGMVYPSLKPMMEASIRRISVTVKWKEGNTPKEFQLVQFVTNPMRGGFQANVNDTSGLLGGAAGGTAGTAGGAGGATGGTGGTGATGGTGGRTTGGFK